jgi:hypothetical protein
MNRSIMRVVYLAMSLIVGCVLAVSGCSTGPEVDVILHESDHGAVYLERMSDRSFKAAHPIKLDSSTIARALRGISVRNDQGRLQNFFSGMPDARRAFTDDAIAHLAPLLADGLMRAAPDQQVAFRLIQPGHPGYAQTAGAGVGSSEPPLTLRPQESTGGVLYAYGRSLYFTLTQYRVRPEPAMTINMANRRLPDNTGLANHTVLFHPEAAKRPDTYRDAHSTDTTLVLDYELLATLPASSDTPGTEPSSPAAAPTEATTGGNGKPAQKDADIEALRKELQDIKRQLAEQEAERARSQKKEPAPQ